MKSRYKGSSSVLTSAANEEVVPEAPSNWTLGYRFYKFSFINKNACVIKVNNGEEIYLETEQGFESDKDDQEVGSFVIVTPDTQYTWIGAW